MSETQSTTAQKCRCGALSACPAIRALSELAGTFFVCFAIYAVGTYGTVVYGANPLFVAVAVAFAYVAATAVFARFSGGHFNPAITLAAVLTSKISWLDAVLYLVAQVIGSIAAGALIMGILPTSKSVPSKLWYASVVNGYGDGSVSANTLSQAGISFGSTMAMVVEVAMTLLVVAAAIATLRANGSPTHSHTLATGLAYGVAVAVTYPVTGAALNPVRSTGIAVFAQGKGLTVEPLSQLWVFWICPLLAGAIVALVVLVNSTVGQAKERKAAAALVAAAAEPALAEPAAEAQPEATPAADAAATEAVVEAEAETKAEEPASEPAEAKDAEAEADRK